MHAASPHHRQSERGKAAAAAMATATAADAVERFLEDGRNVFLTGSQGTGKTTVTYETLRRLSVKGWRVICNASTGVAVQNLTPPDDRASGIRRAEGEKDCDYSMARVAAKWFAATVHRAWAFGWREVRWLEAHGADNRNVDGFMGSYKKKWRPSRERYRRNGQRQRHPQEQRQEERDETLPAFLSGDVVVIDETSMLSGFLLRVLDRVARWWTGAENSAFGGHDHAFRRRRPSTAAHRAEQRERQGRRWQREGEGEDEKGGRLLLPGGGVARRHLGAASGAADAKPETGRGPRVRRDARAHGEERAHFRRRATLPGRHA